tara:strand:+ start:2575 stop:2862 length:288 start_codon:yes stop_codon:yes gene_type:complete
MWEIIQDMAANRLWIYTGIGGAIFGALFITYMRETRISIWVYGKWDTTLDFLINRWGWTWFQQDPEAWKKVHPKLSKKIEELDHRIKFLESTNRH